LDISINNRMGTKRKYGISISISVFIVGFLSYLIYVKTPVIDESLLPVFTVRSGELNVFIPVHGLFKSAQETLLTAKASGVVTEILIKPGTPVKKGDVIARLENPELIKTAAQHKIEFLEQQSSVSALKLKHEQQQLDLESQLLAIDAAIAQSKLDVNIHGRLQKLGVSSKIELEKAQLKLTLQSKNKELHLKKIQHATALHEFEVAQSELQLDQKRLTLTQTQLEVNSLEIKAEQDGDLQNLQLEVGLNIDKGEAIAKIGSRNRLVATLNLPAHKVNDIALDAEVKINLNGKLITTKIKRIESLITQSSVIAETYELHEQIINDQQLRPTQAFSAKVYSDTLKDQVFVARESGLQPHSHQPVYKKVGDKFLTQNVSSSQMTDSAILINQGLKPGDIVVVKFPKNLSYLRNRDVFKIKSQQNKEIKI